MEDALSFDGNTGPYAQYTYARTCSVLEKAGICGDGGMITADEETAVLKTLHSIRNGWFPLCGIMNRPL
jgi:arginyl-tRNA synthetase